MQRIRVLRDGAIHTFDDYENTCLLAGVYGIAQSATNSSTFYIYPVLVKGTEYKPYHSYHLVAREELQRALDYGDATLR